MNPITQTKNLSKINEREIALGSAGTSASWHTKYRDSAWIFIGGLPYQLTEGDVICIFSQFGEVNNVNLIRDKTTGNFKGFGFLCYEDQRSTILAVDNFNGTKILNRVIRVDHVEEYRMPQLRPNEDAETRELYLEGVAPKPVRTRADSSDSEGTSNVKKKKVPKREKRAHSGERRKAKKGKKSKKHREDAMLIPKFEPLPEPVFKEKEAFDPRTEPIAVEVKINPFDHDIRKDPFEKKFANPLFSSFLRKDDAYLPGRLKK